MTGSSIHTLRLRRLFSALRTRTTPSHRFAERPFAIARTNAASAREATATPTSSHALAISGSTAPHLREQSAGSHGLTAPLQRKDVRGRAHVDPLLLRDLDGRLEGVLHRLGESP